MTPITIPKHEHGVIRVFSVSRPMAEMTRHLKQGRKIALASSLLNKDVQGGDIELFALSDLTGVGLASYLTDGYAIDKSDVRADRARLEALDGYVLLLFSTISIEEEVTLKPSADLTLIGTYAEPKAAHSAAPITTDAAKPYSGVTPPPTKLRRSRIGSVFTAAVALVAVILIWWILR